MRSWIFGSKNKEDQKDSDRPLSSETNVTGVSSPSSSRGSNNNIPTGKESQTSRGFFRGVGKQDAEIDRRVSLAARNICNGVQRIVMAAKGKSGVEWKAELLTLLGGSDDEQHSSDNDTNTNSNNSNSNSNSNSNKNNNNNNNSGDSTHCDMDVLLAAPKTEKFIMRCLENELSPNMIHCLRLLRVLELQHAAQTHKENEAQGKADHPIKPISSRATGKVNQLLCTLCSDQSVGEQLRPHLFGLLALSGASYPRSGVHVAQAASQVIIAFAKYCLSNSLVWFLHDRKMIIHMTDDIKELCGQTATDNNSSINEGDSGDTASNDKNVSGGESSSSNSLSLYGADAESAGLWAISLSTVVNLVYHSCRHNCQELMNDFEAAKGYQVLKSAILQSTSMHGKQLMELLPLLATCQMPNTTNEINEKATDRRVKDAIENENLKLASNPSAFDIIDELLYQSIPMLKMYVEENNGKKPEIVNDQSIRDLANYSIQVASKVRFNSHEGATEVCSSKKNNIIEISKSFDIAADLLLSALQLYSEHVRNYDLLEERCHFLTLYILAFPTFEEENLKILILKTIEFVVTGVTGSKALQPFSVLSEVFVVICKSLMEQGLKNNEDENRKVFLEGLFKDTDLINESLEKIFRYDGKVGPQIMQSGKITEMVDSIAEILLKELEKNKSLWQTTFDDNEGNSFINPPTTTPFDTVCAAILRVFSLAMGYQAKRGAPLLTVRNDKNKDRDINYLLMASIKELGDEAAIAALSVFQAIIVSRENLELLLNDMEFCLNVVDYFTTMMSKTCNVPGVAKQFLSQKQLTKSIADGINFVPLRKLNIVVLQRVSGISTMLKVALESSSIAREAFRLTNGFDSILKVVLSLGGSGNQQKVDKIQTSLLVLIQNLLLVVDAAIGFKAQNEPKDPDAGSLIPIVLPRSVLVDPVSSQHRPRRPSTYNLYHIRLKSFYLDFAIAISQTKILEESNNAVKVLELAMSHMDPSFNLTRLDVEKSSKAQTMRNPDAARLVLGLVLFLPETEEGNALAKRAFDQIIRLCDPSRIGTTLSQIAKCGMVWSITNPREFSPILDDNSHHLYPRFTLLLRRVAAFNMSHSDFVSVIRGIAGPLLRDERHDSKIRLPVISSSIRQRLTKQNEIDDPDIFEEKETDFCRRLESLCAIAERGERVPYCKMGGDTINTLSILLHKTKVEDRLYKASEAGRLNFLEVDCLDLSSMKPGGFLSAGVAAPGSSGGERLWTPVATSGFSFSMWFRYARPVDDNREGSIYLFDVSNPTISTSDGIHTPQSAVFLSVWYDILAQRFNVVSSSSAKGEPMHFPVSPLVPGVWHHVLLTYTPTKRTMMGRKSVLAIYINGRPIESEIKIDSVNIAPNARIIIGAPNAVLASSGIVRGLILNWDLGPTLMLSTVLMELDATAIFIYGPDFEGLFWGDRPQRLSLSATGTAAFALLSETGEPGSVASALRRRDIARLEAAGTVSRELGLGGSHDDDNDSLGSLGLLCTIPPDCVVFAYRAGTTNQNLDGKSNELSSSKRRNWSDRLVNLARINNGNDCVSSDASLFGKSGVVNPRCFEDNIQWAGGPQILMPLIYAASSARSLALTLRLFRASTHRHPPNLESMQGGGGFQVLAILIQGKKFIDHKILEQAFAFSVHGFVPPPTDSSQKEATPIATNWVFSDLDAMKQLLLNHQVWDLKNSSPDLPLRLITLINGLVGQKSIHKAFNSRRLHLVGIIRWTLHLMVEAAELYTAGEISSRTPQRKRTNSDDNIDLNETMNSLSIPWHAEAPYIDAVCVGADPDNSLLQSSKTLLRRVLTFMLTPGDLDAIAEATMYTVSIGAFSAKANIVDKQKAQEIIFEPKKLLPGPVTRIYLLRLIEELIVDGVNEIVASGEKKGEGDTGQKDPIPAASHAGGVANPNQSYFSTALLGGRIQKGETHPKHQQAQNFLAAFGAIFTPVWFAALLEGCNEEATASAVLRLMILMIQSSSNFAMAFDAQGGFAPLVISVPKFSTCSTIIITLLSELFHASILHLPSFPVLDASQLNEIFTQEGEISEVVSNARADSHIGQSDPSCGIFALLAECIGRNIRLAPYENEMGRKARATNIAILDLLKHRHNLSPPFQAFCRTRAFIEPLIQTIFMVHDERYQNLESCEDSVQGKQDEQCKSRRGSLKDVPADLSPFERFVGSVDVLGSDAGVAMVQLIRIIISNAVAKGPPAPSLVYMLFSSYPDHARVEQVGAYQLVLVDLIRTTIEDAVELGEAYALSACVGLCSVILDKIMRGFFTSELILHSVAMNLFLLQGLTRAKLVASTNLGNSERTMITADAAHIARLTCLCGIRRSRPMNLEDMGDADLQDTLVQMTAKNIDELMIVPKISSLRRNSSLQPSPSTTSSKYPLWIAASISRCSSNKIEFIYNDLSEVDEPLKMFVTGLMAEIAFLLKDERDDIRVATIKIIVILLQQKRDIMSNLLIKEVETPDNKGTTIDVMNRGGFGALLVAHEVAQASGSASSHKNYDSFFMWYEKNQTKVQIIFDDIESESIRIFPGLMSGTQTADEAVEIEQRAMSIKIASNETADRTIIGGLERAELAQRCIDRTGESHIHWKRQGFDDLASGAMRWKFLLRRLKGSCSIWEGDSRSLSKPIYSRHQQLYKIMIENDSTKVVIGNDGDEGSSREIVTRWKLDLTEGYERQRRRLLPNYEFHSLYNIDEALDELEDTDQNDGISLKTDSSKHNSRRSMIVGDSPGSKENNGDFFVSRSGVEATAELLKELNIKKVHRGNALDDDFDDAEDDGEMQDSKYSNDDTIEENDVVNSDDEKVKNENVEDGLAGAETDNKESKENNNDTENVASSYELITGLLHPGDWPEQSYNVFRCTGLEVRKALLLWCRDSIYIIDGFEQSGEGLDGKIVRVEKEESSFNINLRPKDFKDTDDVSDSESGVESNEGEKDSEKTKSPKKSLQDSSNNEITYQHRSQRIAFSDLHSVFRRRYQLQQIALEFYDVNNSGTLVAFANNDEREEILSKVLTAPLPNSIFSSFMGTSINYRKFMNSWKSKIVSQWVNGKMTNFEFLMYLNSFAGRTYNDLTQYPVFPWVISDYESEDIDLDDPKSFRDFSKPMGALGETRARQFKDRFESLQASYINEDDPPPFHYGTHYSCAAYVLYYLMRLEPFSRLALALQGGRFDVADRLFHNIGSSWKSASQENLQDVRELIPEFFYQPDFLTNTNHFDFGTTQKGKNVHNVTLPKWAKGDPERFVRINRQALESDHVSKNLHKWIDLIFGYKQRGEEAVTSMNTFVHVTYEGEVDLESMTDIVQRESTIAQIQNFGQTPSRLERKPFQQRFVYTPLKENEKGIDYSALSYMAPLTPPFCIVGANHKCVVKRFTSETCKIGVYGQSDKAVGDMCLFKGQIIGVGRMCSLNIASKTYYRYGGPNNGVSVHAASLTNRHRELNKLLTVHDGLHYDEISVAKASLNGQWVVTGSIDSTVRIWKYENPTMKLCATLVGHGGWKITCIDICTVFGVIVTGCAHGRVILWDLRTLTFVRRLQHNFKKDNTSDDGMQQMIGTTSVSINHKNGNIITLVGPHVSVFDINGNLLGTENSLGARPSCAVATDCPEWQVQGIVVVTGHVNGEVRFWSLNSTTREMVVRYLMVDREHVTEITALRATGNERQDVLLVGDRSGKMSICRTINIESLSTKEITEIIEGLRKK